MSVYLGWSRILGTQGTIGPQGATGAQGITGVDSTVVVTASLAAGESADFDLEAGSKFILLSVASSNPAWVRIFGTEAARTADTRVSPGGTLPIAGSGFHAEVVTTTTPQTIVFSPTSPLVQGVSGRAFGVVRNEDSVARIITLTFESVLLVQGPPS